MSIGSIAIEAARAMDIGDYAKVRQLYEGLIEDGQDEAIVLGAFCSEGANPHNIPTQFRGSCYMLRAMSDPAYI